MLNLCSLFVGNAGNNDNNHSPTCAANFEPTIHWGAPGGWLGITIFPFWLLLGKLATHTNTYTTAYEKANGMALRWSMATEKFRNKKYLHSDTQTSNDYKH